MNGKALICVCISLLVPFATPQVYACCESPVASMWVYPNPVCVGQTVTFGATASYDPDCSTCSSCKGVSMIKGIRQFQWDWTNDGTYDYTESPGDGYATHSYSTAGSYTVKLKVYDDDNACCCSGTGCSDKTATCTRTVTVVKVDKLVQYGTNNEGPIRICPGDSANLEAKPYPTGASFPSGEPHWTIVEQSSGTNAYLSSLWGPTTTVGGLTKPGEYVVVRARCGNVDTGDTITVKTPELSGLWEEFVPGFGCGIIPDPPCLLGYTAEEPDSCGHKVIIACVQYSLPWCRFFYWYWTESMETEIGECIWGKGDNRWWYKKSNYPPKVFLKTKNTSRNDEPGTDGEGCQGYWCWRTTIYDCVDGGAPQRVWRRSNDLSLPSWAEDDGEPCPGPPGIHPYYPH